MTKIQSLSHSRGLSAIYDLEKGTLTTVIYLELYAGDDKTQVAVVST